MTVEQIAKNYVREVRIALRKIPKEQRPLALVVFLAGYHGTKMTLGGTVEDLNSFYEKGVYVANNFSRSEIDTANRVIETETEKLRQGLSRKTLWERLGDFCSHLDSLPPPNYPGF